MRSHVLVIYGSPKSDGATKKLCDSYLAKEGISTYQWYDCFHEMPTPCNDCGYCKTHDGCSKPDLQSFYTALEQCDFLIIATPIYNNSFPAPLKALIDRLQVYYNARFCRGIRPPVRIQKEVALLLTAGGSKDCSELIVSQLRPVLTVINATLRTCLFVKSTDAKNEVPTVLHFE